MEILNIGPLELVLIVLLALIVLGPNESINAMRKLGKFFYKAAKSPYWSTIVNTSKEIRDLPNMMIREAGLEESIKELNKTTSSVTNDLKNLNTVMSEDAIEIKSSDIINQKDIPSIEVNATQEIIEEDETKPDLLKTVKEEDKTIHNFEKTDEIEDKPPSTAENEKSVDII